MKGHLEGARTAIKVDIAQGRSSTETGVRLRVYWFPFGSVPLGCFYRKIFMSDHRGSSCCTLLDYTDDNKSNTVWCTYYVSRGLARTAVRRALEFRSEETYDFDDGSLSGQDYEYGRRYETEF